MDDNYLLISGIQHFSFCRRQWALIHVENCWEDNQFTAEGTIMHDKVHNHEITTNRNGIVTLRGLPVRSNSLMITGVCDAVELIPDSNGIEVFGRKGKWQINPVEYKRGKQKRIDCDRLQLVAECMCLEEMLSCEILQGCIYYGETRHREVVDINSDLRAKLKTIVSEMWGYYKRRYTPKVRMSKRCNNCSMRDMCMPEIMKGYHISQYIQDHVNGDDE